MRQVQYQYLSEPPQVPQSAESTSTAATIECSLLSLPFLSSLCPTPTEVGKTANGLKTREYKPSKGRGRKRNNSRRAALPGIDQYGNRTDGRTDGRTDRRTDGRKALSLPPPEECVQNARDSTCGNGSPTFVCALARRGIDRVSIKWK